MTTAATVIAGPQMNVLTDLRQRLTTPRVRPWALVTPIVVLLICLPLLRPLRHPDPRAISTQELALLHNTRAMVERHTSADPDERVDSLLPVLLSVPYLFLHDLNITFAKNPIFVAYLLTLFGATIPVALSAGLIYRMGRIFELSRPRRALLSFAAVMASGLLSYGVVLNTHAPAAALLLAAAAAIAHLAASKRPRVVLALLIAGFFAALAAMVDPAALIFLVLLALTPLFLRQPIARRLLGVALYGIGATGPIAIHTATSNVPLSQTIRDEFTRPAPARGASDDFDDATSANWWNTLGVNLARLTNGFVGGHGIFSHFPIVLLGLFGVAAIMHRHWPMTIKALATATVIGAAIIIIAHCTITLSGAGRMFGPQSFILFLPLVLFWAGAWLRREHHAVKWTMVTILFAFSTLVTLIGATNPCPQGGYDRYTAAQAWQNLRHPEVLREPILAGR